jgi:hypothetical protein
VGAKLAVDCLWRRQMEMFSNHYTQKAQHKAENEYEQLSYKVDFHRAIQLLYRSLNFLLIVCRIDILVLFSLNRAGA